MSKAKEIENYLIDNDIEYFKNDEGVMSIDINNIPKNKFKTYHDAMVLIERR